ncbi:MAG: hypothetical protein LBM04_00755 [Opitutaceae bacterium]|jgi:hypothetical protein|nr:hypothetical protein [Opitutaceae bacterium]
MRQTHTLKLALLALFAPLAFVQARADIAIHEDKISLYGYVAGSVRQVWQQGRHGEPNSSDITGALDAANLGLAFDYKPVSAKFSIYVPDAGGNASDDPCLLDANVTYEMRKGAKITFGRFQSWVGYEAFHIPAQNFITAGADGRLSIIPTYHEGVKYEATKGKYSYGIAILDSVYPTEDDPYGGDGDIGNGYGLEARAGYKGRNLSGALTIGRERNRENDNTDTWVADIYAEYFIPRTKTTIGAEACVKTIEPLVFDNAGNALINNRTNTWFGLVTVRQKVGAKNTLSFRFSAGHKKVGIYKNQQYYDDGSPVCKGGTVVLFNKLSMAFNHAIARNVDFRGEFGYTNYNNTLKGAGEIDKETFLGIQLVLKL